MDITHQNYHSPQVKQGHMSNSQWKSWLTCASATKAEISGKYKREATDAMLVGSYVDAALTTPEHFEAWKIVHAEDIMDSRSKTPKLKSGFVAANTMIERVEADPAFRQIRATAKGQVVLQGNIAGHPWLYLADWIMTNKGGPVILDLKTAANFEDQWAVCQGRNVKIPWYDAWGYWRQLAVGHELYRQMFGVVPSCGIVAVTKQDPCALGVWILEDAERLDAEIKRITVLSDEVHGMKNGDAEPAACGECPWCRSQSTLSTERLAISGRHFTE